MKKRYATKNCIGCIFAPLKKGTLNLWNVDFTVPMPESNCLNDCKYAKEVEEDDVQRVS